MNDERCDRDRVTDQAAERGERIPEGPRAYVPVIATDRLAYCTECGVVVVGDQVGTLMHEIWHGQYERVKKNASYGGMHRPLAGDDSDERRTLNSPACEHAWDRIERPDLGLAFEVCSKCGLMCGGFYAPDPHVHTIPVDPALFPDVAAALLEAVDTIDRLEGDVAYLVAALNGGNESGDDR